MKHGRGKTPEYYAWASMKRRCLKPKVRNFKNYGARGIRVCDRWLNNFVAFYSDMGPRPEGYSLERRDNDGDYTPENCYWAPFITQMNNRRDNHTICVNGAIFTLAQASREFGIPYGRLAKRLKIGWEPFKAVTQPSRGW